MPEMLIDTWTGEERAYGRAARLHIMRVPRLGDGNREANLGVVSKQNGSGVRTIRGPVFYDAFPGKIEDFGKWINAVYDVQEGLVLRIKGFRSGVAHGSRAAQASLYIRMREHAAHRRVIFDATQGAGCHRTFYTFDGRFDIMTREEIEEQIGLVPNWLAPELAESAIERTYRYEELMPEVAPRPVMQATTVKNAEGEDVVIHQEVRRRKIKT